MLLFHRDPAEKQGQYGAGREDAGSSTLLWLPVIISSPALARLLSVLGTKPAERKTKRLLGDCYNIQATGPLATEQVGAELEETTEEAGQGPWGFKALRNRMK